MRRTGAIPTTLATLALLAALAASAAADVYLGDQMGVTTSSVLGYTVSGNQMVGMQVKARFKNGPEETLVWADLSGVYGNMAGGVIGNSWSLIVRGDTFADNAWTLTNNTGLLIDDINIQSISGGVVFDAVYDPPHLPPFTFADMPISSTPGSERGKAIFPFPDPADDPRVFLSASYQDLVGITGDSGGWLGTGYYGDLFSSLTIVEYTNEFRYGSRAFSADTDFIDTGSYRPPLTRSPLPVPDIDMIWRAPRQCLSPAPQCFWALAFYA